MAQGREYTAHQRGIINRHYQNRDTILLTRLGEIVSELALAESDKVKNRLWKRAEQALRASSAKPERVERVISAKSVEALATLLTELDRGKGKSR